MSRGPWKQETRQRHGLKPGPSTRQIIDLKKTGQSQPPSNVIKIPTVPVQADDDFFQSAPVIENEGDHFLGTELLADENLSSDPTTKEVKPSETQTPSELETVENYFTDEEIQEVFEMIWLDGGNFLLKRLKRELITEEESKKLGKLSFKVFKKRLGGKIQALPETALLVYGALVFLSKDKLEQRPASKAPETPATNPGPSVEYIAPDNTPIKILTPEEAAQAQRRHPE